MRLATLGATTEGAGREMARDTFVGSQTNVDDEARTTGATISDTRRIGVRDDAARFATLEQRAEKPMSKESVMPEEGSHHWSNNRKRRKN